VGGAWTTRVTVVEWVGTPVPVPVMVKVEEATGVVLEVATVMVEVVPVAGMGFVLNVAVTPAASPLAFSVTAPVKPPVRAIVTV
jgi:hypothetical protein